MDDSTFPAVLDDLRAELAALLQWIGTTLDLDLAKAETATLD